jgi:hypothetical protein
VLKALIIQDDKGKLKDLEDVIKIARSEGKKAFHTDQNVLVKRIYPESFGYVVVIEFDGCSNPQSCLRKEVLP